MRKYHVLRWYHPCNYQKPEMKKPLLSAKEYEQLKEFPVDNLSLVPKLINSNISVSKVEVNDEDVVAEMDTNRLLAQLKGKRVLNKNASTSRPIYYHDYSVKIPEGIDFKYQPGDSFGFYPKLSNEEVEFLAEKLGVSAEESVRISGPVEALSAFFPAKKIPDTGSLVIKTGEILSRLDIKSFPKKAALRTLAESCQDEKETAVLLFLSSRNGSDAYNRLRTELFSVQMLLAAFESLKPTLEVMASVVGPLQPRFYSCCRKQREGEAASFQIVFNVSENSPESAPEFKVKGVCSSWLESLKIEDDYLPIQQRSISHFRLPETISHDSRPIIMIAAGTGVSPFVGFLEILKSQNLKTFTWLIFGFRNLQDDFIFEDELKSFKNDGTLSRLSLAVSRDPVESKMYVQDVIRRDKKEFYNLITEKDALIYVCGDELKMIKGVNDVIVELILENNSEMNQKEAEGILLKWTKEKKIIRDIWV